jgi:cyclopropane-fatty-acyl-phospholipid synthase
LLPAERERTNQHYDLSPQVFTLFLDPSLKYSSGLYGEATDSLAQAQFRKMEFIARQLGLKGEDRVLDIGCGWGGLLFYLAEHLGCRTVGVTPSPQQAAYIREKSERLGLGDRIRVELAPFQQLALPGRAFEAITLVGSIVHMRDKPGVLAECYRLCAPRGRVYLSETCFRNRAKCRQFGERAGTRFVRETIFGWGELLPLSVYCEYLEDAGFSFLGLTDLTRHYSRTIEDWRRNVLRNREALEDLHPGIVEPLLQYFEIANAGWGYTTKQYAIVAGRSR